MRAEWTHDGRWRCVNDEEGNAVATSSAVFLQRKGVQSHRGTQRWQCSRPTALWNADALATCGAVCAGVKTDSASALSEGRAAPARLVPSEATSVARWPSSRGSHLGLAQRSRCQLCPRPF